MGTAATPTLSKWCGAIGTDCYMGVFTLVLDTTDASGLMTVDLTDYFYSVDAVWVAGSLATTGYFVDVQKPASATALSSTNLVLGFYEAGADGAVFDLVATTDFSAVITGLTLVVLGKQAI